MSFVSVDSSFSLLKINWIGRQIPMEHRVTPQVKIESLLADRCGRKNERSEWRVERNPDLISASLALSIFTGIGVEA